MFSQSHLLSESLLKYDWPSVRSLMIEMPAMVVLSAKDRRCLERAVKQLKIRLRTKRHALKTFVQHEHRDGEMDAMSGIPKNLCWVSEVDLYVCVNTTVFVFPPVYARAVG